MVVVELLYSSFFVITVISTVGHDDMVEEMDAHGLASLLDLLCDIVVVLAWRNVAAGVIVAHGEYGGIVDDGYFHDDTNVYGCLGEAAVADTDLFDELASLVEEQDVEFFNVQIL